MAKQTEFQRQLSDPRWQKKRLQILERDEWTCKRCGDTETTLTVHHKSYRMDGGKFVDYWDYEDKELITLCEYCHSDEEAQLQQLKKHAFFSLRELFENAESMSYLIEMCNCQVAIFGRRIHFRDLDNFNLGVKDES